MIRQTNLANTLDLAADKTRYDACAKKLLSYKGIIAWILKCCTKEFAPYSVQYICNNCLRENAEIAAHAVHQDHKGMMNGDCRIEGLNTEENAISENTVYYDVRFRAFLPENDEFVKFIVNLEIQLNDTPGYPLVMRGFYYCARMISEQYGTVFSENSMEKSKRYIVSGYARIRLKGEEIAFFDIILRKMRLRENPM